LSRSITNQNLLEELAREEATAKKSTWTEVNGAVVDTKTLSKVIVASVCLHPSMTLRLPVFLLKADLARQEAIHSLISSEEVFVKDLTVLRDIHMKKFKESNLLAADQFGVVFSNIVQILSVNRVSC